mgnify:CR=1 FL=1
MSHYSLFTDGASRGNPGLAGAGAVLYSEEGKVVGEWHEFLGTELTNNVAEYRALLFGLKKSIEHTQSIEVFCDSELIVKQINGVYRVKNETLRPLYLEVRNALSLFESARVSHVMRAKNKVADGLANKAIDTR